MQISFQRNLALYTGALVAAFALGYRLAPREILDSNVVQSGLFTVDTTKVLSATVTSLKAESKILVYSYKGDERVRVDRSVLWGLMGGSQELIVPAAVTYYLDMTALTLGDVSFNEKAKIVTMKIPRLTLGDIAFQPEQARKMNGGLLSMSHTVTDELEKVNYDTARRAFVKQAQSPSIVDQAKRQAQSNVQSYFEIPLRIVGHPDVRVVAVFK